MTITRRDFLNGTALAIAAGLAPAQVLHAQPRAGAPSAAYPPALTGLRGNHPGTYTLAHSLAREGAKYPAVLAREAFDLVVVGGGLSGLAAAWFYRRRFGANRRIMILDNHDDFGGHAKRNEFTVRGKRLVTYGGSAEMPASAAGDAAVRELLAGLGLDAAQPPAAVAADPYAALGMGRAVFFDAEHFGRDQWVAGDPFGEAIDARSSQRVGGPGAAALSRFLERAPLPAADRAALARLAAGTTDYLPALSGAERSAALRTMRYAAFLRDHAGIGLAGQRFLRSRSVDAYALDADGISVADAIAIGLPAGANMPAPADHARLGKSPASRLWFADGNASLARLLVQSLIPGVARVAAPAQVASAAFDYSRLDREGQPVRLRLNSTAIAVEPDGPITRVTYGFSGDLHRVEARHVVLAGYNMMIPYLLPSLPAQQKAMLHNEAKAPLVYTKVALDHWQAFAALRTRRIHAPAMPYTDLWLEPPAGREPSDPAVLHMLYVPTVPDSGMPARDRFRAGRALLLGTPFDAMERDIRTQLDRMLGHQGFASKDVIRAITVNRWAHGYSYMPDSLAGENVAPEAAWPGLAGVGNISIANSDNAGSPSLTAAVAQGKRAIERLPG
ncbi:NAD(P)/FAD-dependent oxidoreductase [Cupriavidus taiwanensis]|uniref:NAD(P)/FAD-dependent oxidoreductase n=1 Tax=Cupriavidus taiwanensis TaxID=164546 RepID=UPI000E10C54D|nr:FAD/NAD(P)-binding protein [Cupriavidus taiwanensis]SOY43545.1 putative three-component membrane-bound alcohol deshydrogenase (AdhA) [Cupriavidus taiwanensis]SOY59321.1 putative three-component membrane-bound alcohol deshydrogenase (AdhA) [Cupriavidus taiwanensis]SOY80270.1 putative three-component membrane-bound alcohol deshydrogenase (AdhA) [Cupriavidus taiwanensis]SOZ51547.1 putative three-component membrane-bound alcohol deshydrogenase (AdhA) [Cupriavidus taiwanensis]SOZ76398.1 putative